MNILVAGDYVPRGPIATMIDNNEYRFFDEVRPLTNEHDLSIVNLEAPIVSGNARPIEKCGPNLKLSPKVIDSLQYAGFNMVTLANNHIMDYGKEGLDETLECLKEGDIKYVGVGDNLEEASKIKYFEKAGKKLAVINCCEHEFSIAEYDKAGANPLNLIQQYYSIQEAKNNADYVLVIVHGGHEHWQLPSPRMIETYRFFIDSGADAVVNHHQHCYSGYEVYKDKPIFYGLGNFCFDRTNKPDIWYEGLVVSFEFEAKEISFEIYPYLQCKNTPSVHFINKQEFLKKLNELNSIIRDESKLRKETVRYYQSSKKLIRNIVEPYNNRILNKLHSMGFLPDFIKGRKLKMLENYICCEAHRDKLEYFFKHS